MRKLLLSVVASCALVAFVPAAALAHGHHHARGHHARVHHKRFGTDWSQSGSTTTSSGTGSTSSGDTAGTVQSLTGSLLTIQLTNGSTVSGQVSGATEIECGTPDMSATPGTSGSDGSSGWSGWQGHDHGGDNSSGNNGSGNDQGDDQGQGDDDQSVQVSAQSCDSSSLTPGTVVREAILSVSSNGAVWQKLELMTQSTTSSSSSSSSTGS